MAAAYHIDEAEYGDDAMDAMGGGGGGGGGAEEEFGGYSFASKKGGKFKGAVMKKAVDVAYGKFAAESAKVTVMKQ